MPLGLQMASSMGCSRTEWRRVDFEGQLLGWMQWILSRAKAAAMLLSCRLLALSLPCIKVVLSIAQTTDKSEGGQAITTCRQPWLGPQWACPKLMRCAVDLAATCGW